MDEVRTSIVDAIPAELEIALPQNEANVARLRPSESLEAWSALHPGLARAHLFNQTDDAEAVDLFCRACEMDPGLAAAWAARSFTSYQNAVMESLPDRAVAVRNAQAAAERSFDLDPKEPTANFAMGRLPILTGDIGGGTGWLNRTVELSPSFSKGHYARTLINLLAARTGETKDGIARAIHPSPLDPLKGPILGIRELSLLIDGCLEDAREQALEAVRAGPSRMIGVMQTAAIN